MTLVNFTISVASALLIWIVSRPVSGLTNVARGLGLISAGFALTFFNGSSFRYLTICLSNTLTVIGMFCLLAGAIEFRGFRRPPAWLAAAIAAPFLIGQMFLLENRPFRSMLMCTILGLISFSGVFVMLRKLRREDRLVYGVVASAFAIEGVMQLIRFANALYFRSPAIDPLSLVIMNITMICGIVAISTATNLKLRGQVEKLAFCDPLTGLPNRRNFDRCLDAIHTRALAAGSSVALIYIDLDRFKTINDRFGHTGGDFALKWAADRLSENLDSVDFLARLGGDEFVVLTERFRTRYEAQFLIDRLNRAFTQSVSIAGNPVLLGISCGLAFYPDDASDTSSLIRAADAGMYRAKRYATRAQLR